MLRMCLRVLRPSWMVTAILVLLLVPAPIIPAQNPAYLVREFIYLGDRVLAVESPDNTAPSNPGGFHATYAGGQQVQLTWDPVSGSGIHYEIWRKDKSNTDFQFLASETSTSYSDSNTSSGQVYVYKIRAVDSANPPHSSAWSGPDPALTMNIPDIVANVTPVSTTQVTLLRTAVNAMRDTANLPVISPWPNDNTLQSQVTPIRALHIQDLRDALDPALQRLGLPTPLYEYQNELSGKIIKKKHFQEELRDKIR